MCNKMSSQIYLFNAVSISKFEEFNLQDIEVLINSEKQPSFKRARVMQYLGIAPIITSTTNLAEEDISLRFSCKQKEGYVVWTPLIKTLKTMIYSYNLPVSFTSLRTLVKIKVKSFRSTKVS